MEIGDWTAVPGMARRYRELRDLGLEQNVAELDTFGFTVVPPEKVAADELVDSLLRRITEISAERNKGIKPDFETGATHADFVGPAGQHLFYLMASGREFEEALMHPMVQALVRHLMGDTVLLSSATSMLKGPGKLPLHLHSDQPIHPIPNSLVCNATYLLSDYNKENGALCFLPGSHKLMRQPTPGENFRITGKAFEQGLKAPPRPEDVADVEVTEAPNVVPIEAPKGSLVVWHGNTWHGAFPRVAPGLRVNLILYFCHMSLRPQESYRETLPQEVLDRNDDRFAMLMGKHVHYGWNEEGPEQRPGVAFERHRKRKNARVD